MIDRATVVLGHVVVPVFSVGSNNDECLLPKTSKILLEIGGLVYYKNAWSVHNLT